EVASAIHKAQQLTQQQERAWLTTAQLQVAAALSSDASLEEITDGITRLTPILTGASLCGMMLWDEETAVYQGTSLYSANGHKITSFAQHTCKIGNWHALDAVHIGHTPLTTHQMPLWLHTLNGASSHALTLYPLRATGGTLGVLFVEHSETHDNGAGTPHRLQKELLENIASQVSRAVENAYLRQAQQEEAWVNTVLLQVAEAVNSRIELAEILQTITRLVPMLVGIESVIILIWDEENRVFQAGPSYGISKMGRGLIETLELDHTEIPALIHITSSQVPQMPFYIIQPSPWLEKMMGTPHAHVFPLHSRGRLVGAMLVGTSLQDGRSLPTRRLNILNGIAQQAATAVVNYQLYQEAAERDRLAQELNVAREIQASLIPDGSPDIPGCSVASFWQAARQVSGDFYDFIPLRNGDWGIVVADVADKGIPAALFMALSRTILRTVALNRHDPAEVLVRVNDIINGESQSDLFVTMFYAVWQPRSNTLLYANGGHNPPLLLRHNGKARLLSGDGMALGILPGIEVESRAIRLQANDMLLFYTDGVTEAMNEDFDEFGLERVRLAAIGARHRDATGVVAAITQSIQLHAGDTPQFDDITLVVLKRTDEEL
ncbi:MAG: SpoIIE family protein phosphatase, partial [Ardenticatenaceae bacterium]|nr:SpoIIE family protein phosphatase [Ardenticatenaceae bacterium]